MGEIWAALDLSAREACFSAGTYPDGKIIIDTSFQMRGRDSSELLLRLVEMLRTVNCTLDDVKSWTAGTGPGNYTGLRIVSALISGIVFGRNDKRCHGIPSAFAVASAMGMAGDEKTAVVYPLEEDKVFSFGICRLGDEFFRAEDLTGTFQLTDFLRTSEVVRVGALQRDAAKLPKAVLEKAELIDKFPVADMVFMNSTRWDADSVRDLIYVRPAVNVAPMTVREVNGQ